MQINSKYRGHEKHIHHDHVHCTAYVVHAIHFSHEEEYKFGSLLLGRTTTRLSQKYLDESVKYLPHSCHQSDFYHIHHILKNFLTRLDQPLHLLHCMDDHLLLVVPPNNLHRENILSDDHDHCIYFEIESR